MKWQLKIPSLIAAVSVPSIGIIGCGTKPEDATLAFSVESTTVDHQSGEFALIELNWNLSDANINFDSDSFEFHYGVSSQAPVEAQSRAGEKPYKLKINFGSGHPLLENITDGVLSFKYTNGDAETKEDSVEGIHIYVVEEDFSVEKTTLESPNSSSIHLAWTPIYKDFSFLEPTFTYCGTKTANVEIEGDPQYATQTFNLTFAEPVQTNITDGVLNFSYKCGEEGTIKAGVVNQIEIDKPDPLSQFIVSPTSMKTSSTASIELVWGETTTPNIEIQNAEFKYDNDTKNVDITPAESIDDNKQTFDLSFSDEITANNIIDGHLTFHYKNVDTGFEYDDEVKDIQISKMSFYYDTWENVCTWAEKGLDSLKQHYGEDTFVGKTKMITIDGFEYKLIVIGENEDYLANEDGTPSTTPAALTFMFQTVVQKHNGDETYEPFLTTFSSQSTAFEENLWKESFPYHYLSEDFLPDLEDALDSDVWKNHVKTVSKNTINIFPFGTVASQKEQIFLPSLADIFSSETHPSQLPAVDYLVENEKAYIQEGRKLNENQPNDESEHYVRYSYFDSIVDESYDVQHQELAVDDGKGNEISYWLRSCNPSHEGLLEGHTEWMWHASSDDPDDPLNWRIAPLCVYDESLQFALAPIFCI